MSNTLRVAVFSDIHADETTDDTYVLTEPPKPEPRKHPLADLFKFFLEHDTKVDVVLCPGDLSNKSNDTGKLYGWKALNQIASKTGAKLLVASPGNHDVETHSSVTDIAAVLKNLSPSYPSRDETRDEEFWREGAQILEFPQFRLVNLNSCASFAPRPSVFGSKSDEKAYRLQLTTGRFRKIQQDYLLEHLSTASEKPVNILMCHHHPVEHQLSKMFKDTYGPMERGDELIEVLEDLSDVGRWIIIHGHKHIPMVTGLSKSANSPVVFCSASVGGKLWHPVVSVTRNQFHIITFDLDPVPDLGILRGTVESYMWGYGAGWMPAQDLSGLPAICGFGAPRDHRDLAAQVGSYLSDRALEFEKWSTLTDAMPALRYQTPEDFQLFEQALERAGLAIEARHGMISSIARSLP